MGEGSAQHTARPRASSPARSPARLRRGLAAAIALLVALFMGFLISSCLSGRAAARGFVDALGEHRYDEARAMLSPDLQQRLPGVSSSPSSASEDPGRALSLLWSARTIRWGGVVQSGFAGLLVPYACIDGTLEGDRTFWLVVRKVGGAWQITDLQMTKPAPCEGKE